MVDDIKNKINLSNMKSYFADEVLISANVKARKIKKNIDKEGFVRLLFLNMTNHEPVSEIVLSRFTAERLLFSLKDALGKLEKEMKSKKMPSKKVFKPSKKKTSLNYMG